MGILASVSPRYAAVTPNAAHDFWYRPLGWSTTSASGVVVTPDTALACSAVWACVRLLSEAVGTLPLVLYQRVRGGKERAFDHPLYALLHDRPNTWQTAMQFFTQQAAYLLLYGNAYAEKLPGPRGPVDQLVPLHPASVTVEQLPDRTKRYRLRQADSTERLLLDDEVWHIPGLSLNGVTGVSVLTYARDSIGLALAAEGYGARLFSQDARPGGIVQVEGQLSDDAKARFRESWQAQHAGLANAHKVTVLDEGMKWVTVGMSAEDAQFLLSRQFQVEDVARWFNVPLHLIQHTSKETSWGTGIEHLGIQFIRFSLMPWLRRFEQGAGVDLLLRPDLFFAEFIVDALERADIKTRTDTYATARQWGWLSVNEIRRRENLNAVEGGDEYLVPLNMIPAGQSLPASAPSRGAALVALPAPEPVGAAAAALLPFVRDAAVRVARREAAALGKAAKRATDSDPDAWQQVVRAFYATHSPYVAAALRLPPHLAAAYCDSQQETLLVLGPTAVDDAWEQAAAADLEGLALTNLEERIGR